MRITITCEECGHRHPLERGHDLPGEIWVVCHGCEMPLRAELEPSTVGGRAEGGPPHAAFASAWAGVLDLGRPTP